jgi:hypothetical protein
VLGRVAELQCRAHAVADVHRAGREDAVLLHELHVHGATRNDLARQVVHQRQVGAGLDDDVDVGDVRREVGVGRDVEDARRLVAELAVGHAAPQHRVRFGRVGAAQHDGVGEFDVVVDVGRLVDAEDLHEAHHGAGHAVACVGVQIVGAEARLHQLGRGVAFGDRVLARADDGHPGRALGRVVLAELAFHLVHRHLPGHRREGAVLVEPAVLHAQERLRQPVGAVGYLAVEIALDAVQSAVDRRVGVALGGHHLAALGRDLDAAAGAAHAAHALVPLPAGFGWRALGQGGGGHGQAGGRGGGGGDAGLEEFAAGQAGHGGSSWPRCGAGGVPGFRVGRRRSSGRPDRR